MPGESDLEIILKTLKPVFNDGEYVFCSMPANYNILQNDIIGSFREKEGTTIILSKLIADELKLSYSFVSAWITLSVHSSLESVGLTAVFSTALARVGISCNVVAGYYHDHLFVNIKDVRKAINVLSELSL
jgi:hypothetical protein